MISIIFRIANIAVLLIVGWYAIRRWFVPFIKRGIEEYKVVKAQLQNQVQQEQEHMLNQRHALDDQDRLLSMLSDNLVRWTATMAQQREREEREKRTYMTLAYQRATRRLHQGALAKTQRSLIPRVFSRARTQLEQVYQQPEHGRQFIEQLIQRLQKGSS